MTQKNSKKYLTRRTVKPISPRQRLTLFLLFEDKFGISTGVDDNGYGFVESLHEPGFTSIERYVIWSISMRPSICHLFRGIEPRKYMQYADYYFEACDDDRKFIKSLYK